MREQELKARDKKVQKMTRDGLTEKNLTQGTEKRVSQRLADVSFDQAQPQERATGHRPERSKQKKPQQKQKKPQGSQQEEPEDIDPFTEATAPEIWGPDNAPDSMRGAGDRPLPSKRTSDDQSAQSKRRKKRRLLTKTGRSKEGIESDILGSMPPEKPGRLNFETNTPGRMPEISKTTQHGIRYQEQFKASEVGLPAQVSESDLSDSLTPEKPSRLNFETDTPRQIPESSKTIHRGIRYQERFKASELNQAVELGVPVPEIPAGRRLWFAHEDHVPKFPEKMAEMKRQTARLAADSSKPKDVPGQLFERAGLPPMGQAETDPLDKSRQQKKYKKAHSRVLNANRKLEKAQGKLPTHRRMRLERQYDSEAGKVKCRLQFEPEVIPEGRKPPLVKRAGKGMVHGAKTAALMKGHQKIHEVEHQNVGVEAGHKVELTAERATGRFLRWNKRRIHSRPYRAVRKAKRHVTRANVDMAYQQLLKDNPELQKKTLAKWIQKKKIKHKYAAAAREAAKGAQHTQNVLTATGQIVRAIAQTVGAHKAVLGIVALAVLTVVMFGSMFSSCTSMLSGVQSAVLSSCYVADDKEINDSELKYTELETDLQQDINATEANFPGFDEYRYNIGEIGHNPYELMGYLSAAFDAFTYAQVETELYRLFGLQYTLTREEIVETHTYTDEDGIEHEYEWYVLQTTLAVRPLADIIAGSLTPGEQTDRYGLYMQTYGNRQCYGNPFDFAWLGYVSSPYGYRIHPITGEKNLHRGMDLAVASGTPIKAIQDGRVVSAGDTGSYGLCVVIEDEDGYQSRYAHCSAISVRTGQEVKRGDVIAAVGNTGNSTGPHLHLEVTHNGEYLNPYYFVENGGNGYTPEGGAAGGPNIPNDPGSPMGDGTWEAMLAEAEKYLGYPYVWGGSSPSTSFDCSGYVSWVINHSGVGNVGRLGAQALFNITTPVSRENARPGDLIFFTGTFSCNTPVSHVGIYVGGGRMIHCGDPISYANIDTNYWQKHFYSFGRLPGLDS